MWLDTKLLKATYVPGLQEPGGNGPNPWGSMIPPEARGTLIAAFNSGFKMDQARGGVYFGGQEVRGARRRRGVDRDLQGRQRRAWACGAATSTCRPTSSRCARTSSCSSTTVAGRRPASHPTARPAPARPARLNPALREDDTTVFGATLGNNVYVWRSGVGVTARGALVYAGGPAMSVLSLAKTLQNAGAVRAMELDINTDWVSAFTYRNENPADPNSPVTADKLGGDMSRPVDRYLVPGERDFFAFFADPRSPCPWPHPPPSRRPPPRPRTTKPKR